MSDYPRMIVPVDQVEPVPRRLRAVLSGRVVLDTTRALYVWERPPYPQYYVPVADLDATLLVDEQHAELTPRGSARRFGLRVGEVARPGCVQIFAEPCLERIAATARLEWAALDAWFEEDEEVFVHPRSPYARVDALRSTRSVRVELEGVVLAESTSPVMVFETGLPTRYYLDRTAIDFAHLEPSGTVTACPYKGRTSGYWSVRVGGELHADLAWSYDFPTRALLPIAGLVAFYNERVDLLVDGRRIDRPAARLFDRHVPR
jgi:uncharacterized protein (DUF427 family)